MEKRTIPADPEGMNEQRADWADMALEEFCMQSDAEREDSLADLLCDLMHWADRNGFDFRENLDRAQMHYEAETKATPT